MREECKGLNLGSLLITPVQRVPRYFWLRFSVIQLEKNRINAKLKIDPLNKKVSTIQQAYYWVYF